MNAAQRHVRLTYPILRLMVKRRYKLFRAKGGTALDCHGRAIRYVLRQIFIDLVGIETIEDCYIAIMEFKELTNK